MFAPLYLSNYCVNGCTYCPYHLKNKHIARKQLTQEEIRKEVIALQDMGHKTSGAGSRRRSRTQHDGVLSGQHQHHLQHQTQKRAIRRVNVNIAATTIENYKKLKECRYRNIYLFQETYHKDKLRSSSSNRAKT